MLEFTVLIVPVPVALIFPTIVNASFGLDVPIPTLPALRTVTLAVLSVSKVKWNLSLVPINKFEPLVLPPSKM